MRQCTQAGKRSQSYRSALFSEIWSLPGKPFAPPVPNKASFAFYPLCIRRARPPRASGRCNRTFTTYQRASLRAETPTVPTRPISRRTSLRYCFQGKWETPAFRPPQHTKRGTACFLLRLLCVRVRAQQSLSPSSFPSYFALSLPTSVSPLRLR